MFRKYSRRIATFFQALVWSCLLIILSSCSEPKPPETVTARVGEIRVITSTNGVIEPLDNILVYASIDGFVQSIECREGSETVKGQVLFRMNSPQTQIALAEARAALLETKRQARVVLEGPNKEELDSLQATIEESSLQLRQLTERLSAEESLLARGAVSRESVEDLREQRNLLDVRVNALEEKRENTLNRYTEEDKRLMQGKVNELSAQVQLLEKQAKNASIVSLSDGMVYSLEIKQGAFVTAGQLLARIYQPGKVRLRAYVDEPDLARIQKGQPVTIEWDGMPERKWTGVVETLPKRVVALNNRSVGDVLCTFDDEPKELLPNINVKVEIVTARKTEALVVPRSSVFSNEGEPAVLLPEANKTVIRPVEVGLQTNAEIEILKGVTSGDEVIANPGEVLAVE